MVDPADGSKFWVRVREGKLESEGEELPYAGRVDVQLEAGPEREVKWLRLITAEVDHVSTCYGYNSRQAFIRSSNFEDDSVLSVYHYPSASEG